MSTLAAKFCLMATAMAASMFAGYQCQRRRWMPEAAGEFIMTFVAVFGYPAVSFFSIWGTPLRGQDIVLPLLAIVHTVAMTFISLALAKWLTPDRREQGLFGIAGGLGNNGFTMGAFVLYLLYGESALGLANVYFVLFMPLVVLVMYPIAHHYATENRDGSFGALIRRSLLDWRAISLPFSLLAIFLSLRGVVRPGLIDRWHVVDAIVYLITPLAFFGIGLRLHLSKVLPLWRMLVALAAVRFPLGALMALLFACLTRLTPWPFDDLRWKVYIIEGFVPSAVTMVAVANMFDLRPSEASVLFVGNTLTYLVLVLPLIFALFG